jgi:hypothetical protein
MIPDVLITRASGAETRVFGVLQDVNLGEGWTAYHSLNCSEHAYKHWAEIDFLVVGPEAILVLEVKGGRVQCKDGLWTYTDRFGRSRTSSEGPYGQARSAMYALRGLLAERYRLDSVISERVPFGFGVLFPDIDWDLDTPEAPSSITADRPMLLAPASAARFLKQLVRYWRDKQASAAVLGHDELRRLRAKLRPDVDVYPPLSQRLGQALTEMQHLTEEQYERLESIEQNDRAIVSGGAGTGKTFLLGQFARRCAARGRRVLVVVHSPTLAAHLSTSIVDPLITVSSLETVRRSPAQLHDVLLVDEGQDLMNMDALAELASRIEGGLDDGCWCWFMDENNQAGVAGSFDPQALAYLQSGLRTGKPVKLPLRRNCRNTKEIVRQVQLWTGADIGITEVSGYGTSPQLVAVTEPTTLAAEFSRCLREALDGGAEPGDIGIVTDQETQPACFQELPSSIKRLLTPLTVATVAADLRGRIVWGPASRFKGLERPIVFVLALADLPFDDERAASLYVALTRANYSLCVFTSPTLATTLGNAQRRRLDLVAPKSGKR